MTRPKAAESKGSARRLKVKKETIKDLDATLKGKAVKGGWGPSPVSAVCKTANCPSVGCGDVAGR